MTAGRRGLVGFVAVLSVGAALTLAACSETLAQRVERECEEIVAVYAKAKGEESNTRRREQWMKWCI